MEKELVSVVIPFYNNLDWLKEAIASVIAQSYPNVEIIVVNDGSKEDISSIRQEYGNRIKIINKDNGGAASARNVGIKKSRGKYIAFLDSDDLWQKNKLERQMERLKTTKKHWSVTPYETFGGKRSRIISPIRCGKHLKDMNYNSCPIQTSTVLVEKTLIDNYKIFFPEDFKKGQDMYVWYKLLNICDYDMLSDPLAKFRLRKDNSYKNKANQIKSRARLWELMNNPLSGFSPPNRKLTIAGYKMCYFMNDKIIKGDRESGSLLITACYCLPWLLFKVDNLLLNLHDF